jgi:hypothetical protein
VTWTIPGGFGNTGDDEQARCGGVRERTTGVEASFGRVEERPMPAAPGAILSDGKS